MEEFKYTKKVKRRERKALRKKNRLERKSFKITNKKLPRKFRKAMLGQMRKEDRGEMMALKNAQGLYGDLWNAQQDFKGSLGKLQNVESGLGNNITGLDQYGDADTRNFNQNKVTSGVMNEDNVNTILSKDYRKSVLGEKQGLKPIVNKVKNLFNKKNRSVSTRRKNNLTKRIDNLRTESDELFTHNTNQGGIIF